MEIILTQEQNDAIKSIIESVGSLLTVDEYFMDRVNEMLTSWVGEKKLHDKDFISKKFDLADSTLRDQVKALLKDVGVVVDPADDAAVPSAPVEAIPIP